MSTEPKASLDGRALAMLSNTYFVQHLNPVHPLLKTFGNCRVVCVEIHETDSPAIGLSCPDDDYVHMYSIHELSFTAPVAISA
jgi:hypothetical protein